MTATFDTRALHDVVPLAGLLGMRVTGAAPDAVRLELDWREELCTAAGAMHGGALMSLADTAGAVCAFLNLPDGAAGTTTIESKTNLLAPVRGGTVTATATPLRAGRTLIVVETELRTGDGLVAKTLQSQAVLGG
ncbi:MAG TPA: PaaI family thioesterase [Solirubrobacteraceae bacterium]|nr:PaaI family thioesterase [Solirubrobacteraceae bacterium]